MALTYPLNFPSVGVQSMTMRLVRAVSEVESPFTFSKQIFQHQGTKWEAEITLPPLTDQESRSVQAFLMGLKGQVGTFLFGNPLHTSPYGTATSVTLAANGDAGDDEISCNGNGTLLAGDYFQLGTGLDARIHQVVEDVTVSSGTTVKIEPPLRVANSSGSSLVLNNPKGAWRLSSSDVEWAINNASIHGITIPCVEAV
jgi:hypothetical protein